MKKIAAGKEKEKKRQLERKLQLKLFRNSPFIFTQNMIRKFADEMFQLTNIDFEINSRERLRNYSPNSYCC